MLHISGPGTDFLTLPHRTYLEFRSLGKGQREKNKIKRWEGWLLSWAHALGCRWFLFEVEESHYSEQKVRHKAHGWEGKRRALPPVCIIRNICSVDNREQEEHIP